MTQPANTHCINYVFDEFKSVFLDLRANCDTEGKLIRSFADCSMPRLLAYKEAVNHQIWFNLSDTFEYDDDLLIMSGCLRWAINLRERIDEHDKAKLELYYAEMKTMNDKEPIQHDKKKQQRKQQRKQRRKFWSESN
jgi:hypothetical protein